jgi:hypothetical protein
LINQEVVMDWAPVTEGLGMDWVMEMDLD